MWSNVTAAYHHKLCVRHAFGKSLPCPGGPPSSRRGEVFLKLAERDGRNAGEVLRRDETRFVIFVLASGRTLFERFSAYAPCSDLYEFLEAEGSRCGALYVLHDVAWIQIRCEAAPLHAKLAAPRAELFERVPPKP
jgi:hypothetical protein